MKTLFAMRYEVSPKNVSSNLFNEVELVCRQWIHHVASRHAPQAPIPNEQEYLIERDGIRLESWHFKNADSEAMTRLLLDHPDTNRNHLIWKVDIAVTEIKSVVSVRIKIDIYSTDSSIAIPQFEFSPPNLVKSLLEKFKLSYGGYQILDKPIHIKYSEVGDLVKFIFNESRDFPIILVSPMPNGDLAINPDRIFRKLTGVAYVFVFDSRDTASEFRNMIGYSWSCYGGAVRIYWPKALREGNPRRHRFWTTDSLKSFDTDAFAKGLLDEITEAAAFGSASEKDIGRIEATRRKVTEARSDERFAQLRAKLEESQKTLLQTSSEKEKFEKIVKDLADWNKLYEAELEDKEAVKRENQNLHQLLLEKESQIEQLRFALDKNQCDFEEIDFEPPKTLEDVVLAVKQLSNESQLMILPTAINSAKDSSFRNPERVYKALLGLSHAARLYHLNIEGKQSIDTLRLYCGISVTPDISPTTKKKYGQHYEFMYEGKRSWQVRI